jgi:hypothetical protein
VPLDRRSVEDVNACDVGRVAVGSDALGNRVEDRFFAAARCTLAPSRAYARATAHPIARLAP